jgi:UDP-glucose 4-epimerase
MTIVLTGGTGFLGKALLTRLAARDEVIALHRPGTQAPAHKGVRWIEQDLVSRLGERLPDRVAAVIHIAQSRHYREFPEFAVDVMEVNAMATTRLLDYCRRAGGEKFIYASSGAVNAPSPDPVREDDTPAPGNLYAVSKRAGEQVVEQYRSILRAHCLRYFFIYGPGQERMMMPGIVERIAAGQDVQLAGDDGIRMNPVYVDDAAEATVAALDLDQSATVNVAGPKTVTVRRIAELIGAELGTAPHFAAGPQRLDLVASTERMRALLTEPVTVPAEGLRRMVAAR